MHNLIPAFRRQTQVIFVSFGPIRAKQWDSVSKTERLFKFDSAVMKKGNREV